MYDNLLYKTVLNTFPAWGVCREAADLQITYDLAHNLPKQSMIDSNAWLARRDPTDEHHAESYRALPHACRCAAALVQLVWARA